MCYVGAINAVRVALVYTDKRLLSMLGRALLLQETRESGSSKFTCAHADIKRLSVGS